MTCGQARLALGAYVLGALDPAERGAVQAHLDGCPACRDELAALAGLPGLLGHLTAADVEGGAPTPSPGLLGRLLAGVAAERRRTARRRRWLAAAAVTVVLAAGGTAAGLALGGGPGTGDAVTVSATDPHTHVSAAVRLDARGWGTELHLRLSGVPAAERCRLVAVAADGHREQGAAWRTGYAGDLRLTGAVAIGSTELRRLEVVTFAGRTLVSVPVPATAGNAAPGEGTSTW